MTTENKYPETKYKSAYYLGDKLLNFFFNFREESKSFSFIIRKGQYNFIYNLTAEEKLPFATAVLKQLSRREIMDMMETIEE